MTPNIDKDCTHVFKENKLKKETKKFIILEHPAPVGKGFDFIVHKDSLNDLKITNIKEHGYKVPCRYKDKFLRENKDYIYLWSEDNGHIPTFNWIEDWICEIQDDKDFIIIKCKEFKGEQKQ